MVLGRCLSRASLALAIVACSGNTEDRSQGAGGDASSGSGGSGATAGTSSSSGGASGSSNSGGAGGSAASSGVGGAWGTGGGPSTGGIAGVGGAGVGGASGSGAIGGTAGSSGAAATCSDAGTLDASSTEEAIAQSCAIAIVRVSRLDEECSGLGGTHVTFAVVEMGRGSPLTAPTYGGHGYFPQASGPDQLGDLFVAGIDPYGALVPRADNSGWCLTGLPPVDGYAHTLLVATDLADARAKMQAILSR